LNVSAKSPFPLPGSRPGDVPIGFLETFGFEGEYPPEV
jgi:hypothetical protein